MFTGGTNPALTKLNDGVPGVHLAAGGRRRHPGPGAGRISSPTRSARPPRSTSRRGTTPTAPTSPRSSRTRGRRAAARSRSSSSTTTSSRRSTARRRRSSRASPDGWLFIDFCPTFAKLALPLARTGKWDPAKTFGSDTLIDCQSRGTQELSRHAGDPGERLVRLVVPGLQGALREEGQVRASASAAWTAEAFDSAFIAFLAALEAKSSDPAEIAEHVVSVTNDPGKKYTFEQLDEAIKAVLDGQKIHFNGATGRSQLLGQRPRQLTRLRHLAAEGRTARRRSSRRSSSSRPVDRPSGGESRSARAAREPSGSAASTPGDAQGPMLQHTRTADGERPHHRHDPGADRRRRLARLRHPAHRQLRPRRIPDLRRLCRPAPQRGGSRQNLVVSTARRDGGDRAARGRPPLRRAAAALAAAAWWRSR